MPAMPSTGRHSKSLRVDRVLKVIPVDGCHRRVRRELLLWRDQRRTADFIPDWLGSQPLSRYTPLSGYRALSPARMRRLTA